MAVQTIHILHYFGTHLAIYGIATSAFIFR